MSDTKAPTLPTRQEVAAFRRESKKGRIVLSGPDARALCTLIEAQERLLEEARESLIFAQKMAGTVGMSPMIAKLEAFLAR
jgi:hypothetical protein